MRRAFTLIELLVVMAIMGVLGTIAAGSYVAMNRGQAEKSALEIAGNLTEIARQRANLDRCRTYVFIYNEVQSLDENDEPGRVCGLALAVKGVGRFSAVDGNDWYDEFGDLDQLFRAMESESEGELTEADYERKSTKSRIFNLRQQDFAVVRTGQRSELTEEDLEDGETHQQVVFGYRKLEGNASFVVGEEYGREFAAARLPNGFVFSDSVSMRSESDLGLKKVGVYVINPDDDAPPTLRIYSRRIDGSFKPLGSTADVETEN